MIELKGKVARVVKLDVTSQFHGDRHFQKERPGGQSSDFKVARLNCHILRLDLHMLELSCVQVGGHTALDRLIGSFVIVGDYIESSPFLLVNGVVELGALYDNLFT